MPDCKGASSDAQSFSYIKAKWKTRPKPLCSERKLRSVDLEFICLLSAIGKQLHSASSGGTINILKKRYILESSNCGLILNILKYIL